MATQTYYLFNREMNKHVIVPSGTGFSVTTRRGSLVWNVRPYKRMPNVFYFTDIEGELTSIGEAWAALARHNTLIPFDMTCYFTNTNGVWVADESDSEELPLALDINERGDIPPSGESRNMIGDTRAVQKIGGFNLSPIDTVVERIGDKPIDRPAARPATELAKTAGQFRFARVDDNTYISKTIDREPSSLIPVGKFTDQSLIQFTDMIREELELAEQGKKGGHIAIAQKSDELEYDNDPFYTD